MLLSIYLVFACLCAVIVNTRARFDPFLVILPCALLVTTGPGEVLSIFVSALTATSVYAGYCVYSLRQQLTIESVTRLGAGLSLGAFVGVQLLFLWAWTTPLLLGALALITLVNALGARWPWLALHRISPRLAILTGLVIGVLQSLGLSSGMSMLAGATAQTHAANRCALWCFSLMGALVGVVALPQGMALAYWSPGFVVAGIVGYVLGIVLVRRTRISLFESKVLNWIVLAMCLSVWGHLILKHLIFSS